MLVDVGEVQIATRVVGSGPPLLLLHGYPQTRRVWRRVADALADRFTVVTTDLRGYGDSSKPAGDDAHVKTSAAWLIERAGFGKGFGMPGPAALSTKHTLAVTNRGTASASDIVELARHIRDGVERSFGVRLVNEPVLVGCEL